MRLCRAIGALRHDRPRIVRYQGEVTGSNPVPAPQRSGVAQLAEHPFFYVKIIAHGDAWRLERG